MKILLIAPSAYLLGGVQDWLYLLTLGLREKGHDITVAIPNDIYHNGDLYNKYYAGINAIYFRNRTGTAEGRIRALADLLLNHPVDVVASVNIGDVYEAYNRVLYKLKETKIVMTLHAIEGDYLGDIGRYCQLLDGVIVTNKLTQKIISGLKLIEGNKIFYAPYGVKSNYNLSPLTKGNDLRIAWVGRLDNQQKRISDLATILTSLDRKGITFTLSIAGDGPDRTQLENELQTWIQTDRVRLLGFLDKSKLQSFYNNHNILLITSEWETGPIVAWEAMMSGLVVVSSEYIGHASEGALVNEQTALLYPIGSGEAAARQLSRLTNTHIRKELAKRGQQMAISRYSLDSSLKSWEEAFKLIIMGESRKKMQYRKSRTTLPAGGLESIVGSKMGELLRLCLGKRGYCRDAGSEWPHSHYGHTNSTTLLKYATLLEQNA